MGSALIGTVRALNGGTMSEQKLNQEQREKIISLYAGGLSAEAIGRRFGVCAAQVRKIIKRTRDEG